jgi:hypothetical protein
LLQTWRKALKEDGNDSSEEDEEELKEEVIVLVRHPVGNPKRKV